MTAIRKFASFAIVAAFVGSVVAATPASAGWGHGRQHHAAGTKMATGDMAFGANGSDPADQNNFGGRDFEACSMTGYDSLSSYRGSC